MDIADRLKQILQYYKLSSSQFADATGIPRPTFSQIITGRNKKVSNEIFSKIHSAFPNLNILWLMFGEGEIATDIQHSNLDQATVSLKTNNDNRNSDSQSAPSNNKALQGELIFDAPGDDNPNINTVYHAPSNNEENVTESNASTIVSSKTEAPPATQPLTQFPTPTKEKKILSIIAFYSDNTFETFKTSK